MNKKEREIRKEYEELKRRGIIREIDIFSFAEEYGYFPKPPSIEEMERAVIEGRKRAARLKEKTKHAIKGTLNKMPNFNIGGGLLWQVKE